MTAGEENPAAAVSAIGQAAGRGLRWSLFGTVAIKIASFGMGLVLARLLSPADFGIYAIALSATQFVMHINDVGLIAAAVQWRGRFESMAPTATTMAIGFSLVVYGVFWALAPSFAALAGGREATGIVRLLTFTIVIDGLTAVRSASLMRHFQQDRLMMATGSGFVANFVIAISVAASGGGAHAFVYGQLAGSAVTGALIVVLARVPIRLGLDRAIAGKLLRFGIPLAASLGVEALLMNADYVIVGKLFGVASLGYYLLAFNTSSWAVSVMGTAIRYVSIPAFARLSDRETESLSQGVQRSVTMLITVVTPVVVLMSSLAPELIEILYGAVWAPAAPVLRLLMIFTAVRLLTSLSLDVLTGVGATRSILWVNLVWATVLVPALYCGTRLLGIRGTALAHVLVGLLVAVPLAARALHRQGVRLAPVPRMLVRPLLGGLFCLGLVLATAAAAEAAGCPAVLTLGIAGGLGLVCYVGAAVPGDQVRSLILRWRSRRSR